MKKITSNGINKKIVGEIDNNSSTLLWNRFFSKRPIVRKLFEEIGNAKTTLFLWCINNKDKKNKIGLTYSQISDETGISLSTVNRTMQIFLDHGFLKKSHRGYYMVNPEVAFRGGRHAFEDAILEYRDFDKIEHVDNLAEREQEKRRKAFREKYKEMNEERIRLASKFGEKFERVEMSHIELLEDTYATCLTEKESEYRMVIIEGIYIGLIKKMICDLSGEGSSDEDAVRMKWLCDELARNFGKDPDKDAVKNAIDVIKELSA